MGNSAGAWSISAGQSHSYIVRRGLSIACAGRCRVLRRAAFSVGDQVWVGGLERVGQPPVVLTYFVGLEGASSLPDRLRIQPLHRLFQRDALLIHVTRSPVVALHSRRSGSRE